MPAAFSSGWITSAPPPADLFAVLSPRASDDSRLPGGPAGPAVAVPAAAAVVIARARPADSTARRPRRLRRCARVDRKFGFADTSAICHSDAQVNSSEPTYPVWSVYLLIFKILPNGLCASLSISIPRVRRNSPPRTASVAAAQTRRRVAPGICPGQRRHTAMYRVGQGACPGAKRAISLLFPGRMPLLVQLGPGGQEITSVRALRLPNAFTVSPVSAIRRKRLGAVPAEPLVRGDPFVGHHGRAQRDLAAEHGGRDDLGELAHPARPVAAEQFQALALGGQPGPAAVGGDDQRRDGD